LANWAKAKNLVTFRGERVRDEFASRREREREGNGLSCALARAADIQKKAENGDPLLFQPSVGSLLRVSQLVVAAMVATHRDALTGVSKMSLRVEKSSKVQTVSN
jgi:hypothetical protein